VKELGRGRGSKASTVPEESEEDLFDSDDGDKPDEEDNDLDDSDRSEGPSKEVRPASKSLSSTPIATSKPVSYTPMAILRETSTGNIEFDVFHLRNPCFCLPNPCFCLIVLMFKHELFDVLLQKF
jgi:hypothetical protein